MFVLQMALRPIVQADGRPVRPSLRVSNSSEAVTRYRVLSENGSAALVECTPETGECLHLSDTKEKILLCLCIQMYT